MTNHKTIDLELKVDKPDCVWRYIYAMKESECSHDDNARYLFLHALVQWGIERDVPKEIFTIAIQYFSEIGKNVDVSQPAHLIKEDLPRVLDEFKEFVSKECETN